MTITVAIALAVFLIPQQETRHNTAVVKTKFAYFVTLSRFAEKRNTALSPATSLFSFIDMRILETKRQLKLILSLLYYGICRIEHKVSKLLGRPQKSRLTILYYHSVRPEERKRFARQMAALHIGPRAGAAAFRGNLQPQCKHLAITFDDGFVSFAENALPELALWSFPRRVFVPVGALGRRP